eukprot:Rhum_TRINITY_DN14774_c10_g1::Rhum_TRINITY_DN14774_c10_g1_i1::g.116290::m.116290
MRGGGGHVGCGGSGATLLQTRACRALLVEAVEQVPPHAGQARPVHVAKLLRHGVQQLQPEKTPPLLEATPELRCSVDVREPSPLKSPGGPRSGQRSTRQRSRSTVAKGPCSRGSQRSCIRRCSRSRAAPRLKRRRPEHRCGTRRRTSRPHGCRRHGGDGGRGGGGGGGGGGRSGRSRSLDLRLDCSQRRLQPVDAVVLQRQERAALLLEALRRRSVAPGRLRERTRRGSGGGGGGDGCLLCVAVARRQRRHGRAARGGTAACVVERDAASQALLRADLHRVVDVEHMTLKVVCLSFPLLLRHHGPQLRHLFPQHHYRVVAFFKGGRQAVVLLAQRVGLLVERAGLLRQRFDLHVRGAHRLAHLLHLQRRRRRRCRQRRLNVDVARGLGLRRCRVAHCTGSPTTHRGVGGGGAGSCGSAVLAGHLTFPQPYTTPPQAWCVCFFFSSLQ